jgi:hypothetical protein
MTQNDEIGLDGEAPEPATDSRELTPAVAAPPRITPLVLAPGVVNLSLVDVDCDLPDGVYFGLDEIRYHKQKRLGSTSIKNLRVSGPEFWWGSWMNEFKEEEEDKDSLTSGSALHKIVLEGEDEFERTYTCLPHPKRISGCLETTAQMKAWLTAQGVTFKKSASKPEFIALVQATAAANGVPCPPIYEILKAEIEASGKIVMKEAMYARCRLSSGMIVYNPWLAPCFQNGYPEVSILWTENVEITDKDGQVHAVPVRCKARIDYLKLRASVDLKTMANQGAKPFNSAVVSAIGNYRYDTQFAHYFIAREQARALVSAGLVFDMTGGRKLRRRVLKDGAGPALDADRFELVEEPLMPPRYWLDDFAKRPYINQVENDADGWTWVWVYTQKSGAPVSRGYEYWLDPALGEDAAFASRRGALETYARHMVEFGTDFWPAMDKIERMDARHLPSWIRD